MRFAPVKDGNGKTEILRMIRRTWIPSRDCGDAGKGILSMSAKIREATESTNLEMRKCTGAQDKVRLSIIKMSLGQSVLHDRFLEFSDVSGSYERYKCTACE